MISETLRRLLWIEDEYDLDGLAIDFLNNKNKIEKN